MLPQKSHALVSRTVRDMSLQSMMGVDVVAEEANDPDCQAAICPDDDQPADCEEAATAGAAVTPEDPVTMDVDGDDAATAATDPAVDASKALVSAVKKKRRLYRQLTGSEVPWFPHDNDIDLLKELVHEAKHPRWVYYGTPAGGAGMHGCMEMGCSVMALCYDEHHRENLGPFLVQRAVEDMLGQNTMVFRNETLCEQGLWLIQDDRWSTDARKLCGRRKILGSQHCCNSRLQKSIRGFNTLEKQGWHPSIQKDRVAHFTSIRLVTADSHPWTNQVSIRLADPCGVVRCCSLRGQKENRVHSLPRLLWPIPSRCASCVP